MGSFCNKKALNLLFPNMKIVSLSLACCICVSLFSQGPVITPLKGNAQLRNSNGRVSVKRSITDTLTLPFMDDFTTTKVYPDMNFWTDSNVFINDDFPVSPPSYGVATFDNLNKKGAPYHPMTGLTTGPNDTLTSNNINLARFRSGLSWVDYRLSDSIYLSFFFQCQGLGSDILDNSDSLVLKFKDTGGDWHTVWKTIGTKVKPFKQVLVGIKDARYLTSGFRLRFINYGKFTGNMNQWHLDYIRMKRGRNYRDTVVEDLAINGVPEGPLKLYESMPYDHFIADSGDQKLSYHMVKLRNNYTSPVQAFYRAEVRDQNNTLIANYPETVTARNINALSDSSEKFLPFTLKNLPGKEPTVHVKYTLRASTNDNTAGSYNSTGNNNIYTKTVKFRNYLAYDDGTAEGGYGLDYGSLPAGPGYAAIRFDCAKSDTLRGLSIFFNRSVTDVSFKPYTLIIWRQITLPPANNMNDDIIMRRVNLISPIYTDSINGFTDIVFDTAVILPQGTFYAGWLQTSDFILNVGYDANYRYQHEGGRNENLFYNLNGYWEKVNTTITGAVMIRPLLGRELPHHVGVTKTVVENTTFIYPNPSGNAGQMMIRGEQKISRVKLFDLSGRQVLDLAGDDIRQVDISALQAGFYNVVLTDENQQTFTHKYIKQ